MPINIKDIDRGIGVLITSSDSLEDTEYFEALQKHLTQDEAKFKKYRYTICDLTGLTKINVSNKTVEQVARLCEAAAAVNPYPVTGIAAPNDLAYALSRMTQMLLDETEWEYEVFRNREDAEAWVRERVREKFGIDDLTLS